MKKILLTLTALFCVAANAGHTITYQYCGPSGFKIHRAHSFAGGPAGATFTDHQIVDSDAWPGTIIRHAGLVNSPDLYLNQPSGGVTYGEMLGVVYSSVNGVSFTGVAEFPVIVCDCSGGHSQNSIAPKWPKGLDRPEIIRGTGNAHPVFIANRDDPISKQREAMAEKRRLHEHTEVTLDDGRSTTLAELYPHDGMVPGDVVSESTEQDVFKRK